MSRPQAAEKKPAEGARCAQAPTEQNCRAWLLRKNTARNMMSSHAEFFAVEDAWRVQQSPRQPSAHAQPSVASNAIRPGTASEMASQRSGKRA